MDPAFPQHLLHLARDVYKSAAGGWIESEFFPNGFHINSFRHPWMNFILEIHFTLKKEPGGIDKGHRNEYTAQSSMGSSCLPLQDGQPS